MRALVSARWEGNVRELRNVVESLVVLTPGDRIRLEDLPEEYRGGEPGAAPAPAGPEPDAPGAEEPRTMDEIERQAIIRALERTGGNRTQAAEMLGIGLRTLQRKLKEYKMAGKTDGR
jgi:DNA-binding NtrC family response regulator